MGKNIDEVLGLVAYLKELHVIKGLGEGRDITPYTSITSVKGMTENLVSVNGGMSSYWNTKLKTSVEEKTKDLKVELGICREDSGLMRRHEKVRSLDYNGLSEEEVIRNKIIYIFMELWKINGFNDAKKVMVNCGITQDIIQDVMSDRESFRNYDRESKKKKINIAIDTCMDNIEKNKGLKKINNNIEKYVDRNDYGKIKIGDGEEDLLSVDGFEIKFKGMRGEIRDYGIEYVGYVEVGRDKVSDFVQLYNRYSNGNNCIENENEKEKEGGYFSFGNIIFDIDSEGTWRVLIGIYWFDKENNSVDDVEIDEEIDIFKQQLFSHNKIPCGYKRYYKLIKEDMVKECVVKLEELEKIIIKKELMTGGDLIKKEDVDVEVIKRNYQVREIGPYVEKLGVLVC